MAPRAAGENQEIPRQDTVLIGAEVTKISSAMLG